MHQLQLVQYYMYVTRGILCYFIEFIEKQHFCAISVVSIEIIFCGRAGVIDCVFRLIFYNYVDVGLNHKREVSQC